MEKSEFIKIRGRNFVCQLCDIKITSEQAVDDHLGGKKHQRLVSLRDSRQQQAERSVFVGGLCRLNGELEIGDYFSQFGAIAQIIIDKDKGHYAIVEFTSSSSAMQATEVERQVMNNRKIVVRPREPKIVHPRSQLAKKKETQKTGNTKVKKQVEQHKLNESLYQGLLSEKTVSGQLISLVRLTELNEADNKLRHLICNLLQSVLEEFLPRCRVIPFGSSVNGFGTRGCDLDIHLDVDESGIDQSKPPEEGETNLASATPLDILCLVSDVIKRCVPSCHNVHTIPSARLPVVKFTHKESGLHCDVSINNRFALQNTKLLQFYSILQPQVRPLVFAIRHWAKVHQLAGNVGAGPRLTNYALTLMVLFYLQAKRNPIIPSVDELRLSGSGCESIFTCEESRPTTENTETLGDVLTGFFEFYESFDFVTTVICPLSGKMAPLAEVLKCTEGFKSGEINIQDPFELWHNVALNVNEKTATRLSGAMSAAAGVCRNVMKGDCGKSECEPWGLLVLLKSCHLPPQTTSVPTTSKSTVGTATEEEVCIEINLKSSHLSERFVRQHTDSAELKSAWYDAVKSLAYRVLLDTLKFDCCWMSDESEEVWNTEKDKESSLCAVQQGHGGSITDNLKSYVTKEGDCGDVEVLDTYEASKSPVEGAVGGTVDGSESPPCKRCKVLSFEEDRPHPVSDEQSKINARREIANSLTWSHRWHGGTEILHCTAFHPVWLGRRKARRKMLQSRRLSEQTNPKHVIDTGQASKGDQEAGTGADGSKAMSTAESKRQTLVTSSNDSEVENRMCQSQTGSQDTEDILILEGQVTSDIISDTTGGTSSPLLRFSLRLTDKIQDGAAAVTMHFVPLIANTNFKTFLHFFDMFFRKTLDQIKI